MPDYGEKEFREDKSRIAQECSKMELLLAKYEILKDKIDETLLPKLNAAKEKTDNVIEKYSAITEADNPIIKDLTFDSSEIGRLISTLEEVVYERVKLDIKLLKAEIEEQSALTDMKYDEWSILKKQNALTYITCDEWIDRRKDNYYG